MRTELQATEQKAAASAAEAEDAEAGRRAAEKKLTQALKDLRKSLEKQRPSDEVDTTPALPPRSAHADETSAAPAAAGMSQDDLWATVETAVNVAVRKAEGRFRDEREVLEEKVRNTVKITGGYFGRAKHFS